MIGSLFATPPNYIPRAQPGPRMNLVNPDPTDPMTKCGWCRMWADDSHVALQEKKRRA